VKTSDIACKLLKFQWDFMDFKGLGIIPVGEALDSLDLLYTVPRDVQQG
jgi:hypothetical protein